MNKKAYKIYVADCVADGGIYLYDFANGALTEKQKLTLDRPMYLAIEKEKLYAVLRAPFDGSDISGILSLDIGKAAPRYACVLCVKGCADQYDAFAVITACGIRNNREQCGTGSYLYRPQY